MHKVADNLEISDLINKSDRDQTDRFGDRAKKLVENIYEEIKENFEQENKGKGQFVKAIIRIFYVLLNTKISSIKKIKKKQNKCKPSIRIMARTKLTVRRLVVMPAFVLALGQGSK